MTDFGTHAPTPSETVAHHTANLPCRAPGEIGPDVA